ncbi:hypothetical protein DY000_02030310 [Brassica cretica]|uniref:Uncharacterized protein n=1 Tax=Brassica cretica TaxID=69181 RepID=A0ABQ7DLL5_BRACR|nr:hypothetical protein DY000_02030310 [Brassica cretica]
MTSNHLHRNRLNSCVFFIGENQSPERDLIRHRSSTHQSKNIAQTITTFHRRASLKPPPSRTLSRRRGAEGASTPRKLSRRLWSYKSLHIPEQTLNSKAGCHIDPPSYIFTARPEKEELPPFKAHHERSLSRNKNLAQIRKYIGERPQIGAHSQRTELK